MAADAAMSEGLRGIVREVLEAGDAPLDAVLRAVRARGGIGVSRAAVERALVADPACSSVEELGRIRWHLDVERARATDEPSGVTSGPSNRPA
jgi:hypothetical protein